MSEKKSHIAFRILKVLGWALLSLIILSIAFRFSLKTSPVHNFAKNKAETIGNEYLNGTLNIGKIEGDLWKNFSIHDLQVTSEADTLIYFQQLSLEYNIWALIGGTFSSSDLTVSASGFYVDY